MNPVHPVSPDLSRAIFLDRDGVLNRERPDYVKSWAEFEFLPGVLDALRCLAGLSLPILVVTNQSAVGRGLVAAITLDDIHRRMLDSVSAAGGRIDAVFVCSHHPADGCACRKPRPGLLLQAAGAFHLHLPDCYLVGDAPSDLHAARAAGCRPILVRTGLAGPDLPRLLADQPDVPLVADLAAAVELLVTAQFSPSAAGPVPASLTAR